MAWQMEVRRGEMMSKSGSTVCGWIGLGCRRLAQPLWGRQGTAPESRGCLPTAAVRGQITEWYFIIGCFWQQTSGVVGGVFLAFSRVLYCSII